MDHLDPGSNTQDGIGDPHAEIHVEVGFQRLLDALADFAHQVGDGVRRKHAKGVHHRQGVHMPFGGHPGDQVQEPVDLCPRRINREEDHVQALLVGVAGGGHRQLDGLLKIPAIGLLDDVLAGRHLHYHS